MALYRVRDWREHFERGRKGSEVVYRWVAIPTKHDGKGFRRLARHPDAVAVFCAWNLILQVAAKMPQRGVLEDENGALDAEDLADMTGFPADIFSKAFKVLTDKKIAWIVEVSSPDKSGQVRKSPSTGQDRTGQDRTGQDRTGEEYVRSDDRTPPPERGKEPLESGSEESPRGSSPFDCWWAAWPKHHRKVGKSKCKRYWDRQGLDPIAEQVMAALRLCKESQDWLKNDGEFIPMPQTWLNRTPWETDPAEMVGAPPKRDGFDPMVDDAPWTPELDEVLAGGEA